MKRNLSLLFVVCLFIGACKKESKKNITTTSEPQKVTFVLSGLSQSQSPFQNDDKLTVNSIKTLATRVENVTYLVYSSTGTFVKKSTFQSNTNFIDNLAVGSYSAVFITSPENMWINSDSAYYSNRGYSSFPELFYKKISFSVTTDNNQQNVLLSHLNAQIKVIIKDAVPANIKVISMDYQELIQSYIFKTDIFRQVVAKYPEPYTGQTGPLFVRAQYPVNAIPGAKNTTFTALSTNVNSPFSITLNCYDFSGKLILSKSINYVTCQSNKVTLITGELFNNPSVNNQGTVNVKPDTAWQISTNVIHF